MFLISLFFFFLITRQSAISDKNEEMVGMCPNGVFHCDLDIKI